MTNHVLRVTLSTNAGLILEYQGTKLLLDGIYGAAGHPFSNVGEERWEKMLTGTSPYDNIDYLLFTHRHPDHFSPELVLEYLKAREIKGLVLPAGEGEAQANLLDYITEHRIPCLPLTPSMQKTTFRLTEQINVQAFSTLHLDKKFQDVSHYCYLISFDDKHLLFTADVDYTTETFSSIGALPLRAAFINPLFFHALCNNRFFSGTLYANTFCIYHVPFPEDDRFGMRPMLARDLQLWPQQKPEAIVLCNAFQQIEL